MQRAITILKKQGFVRGATGVGVFVTAYQPIVVEASHYCVPARDGEPYPWISEAAQRLIKGGSPRVLAELGKAPGPAVDDVEATMATVDEFVALQLPDDMPVLRQFRVVYTSAGESVEVTEMIKAAHQYKARYFLPGPDAGPSDRYRG